jgi:hypothetical protein
VKCGGEERKEEREEEVEDILKEVRKKGREKHGECGAIAGLKLDENSHTVV